MFGRSRIRNVAAGRDRRRGRVVVRHSAFRIVRPTARKHPRLAPLRHGPEGRAGRRLTNESLIPFLNRAAERRFYHIHAGLRHDFDIHSVHVESADRVVNGDGGDIVIQRDHGPTSFQRIRARFGDETVAECRSAVAAKIDDGDAAVVRGNPISNQRGFGASDSAGNSGTLGKVKGPEYAMPGGRSSAMLAADFPDASAMELAGWSEPRISVR